MSASEDHSGNMIEEYIMDAVKSPLMRQYYVIMSHTSYKFHEIREMPFMLKQLIYLSIQYDYELKYSKDDEVIDMDTMSDDEWGELGMYRDDIL